MKVFADLPIIDHESTAYKLTPFPVLADWACQWKIARSPRGLEILDYDLCRKSIIDPRLGTGHPRLMNLLGLPEGPALEYKRSSISFFNRGKARQKLRRPIDRLLGRTSSQEFRDEIRQIVNSTVASIPSNQSVDLVSALCDPIPSRLYCHWVNAPAQDAEFIARTSHVVQQVHTRDKSRTEEIVEGFDTLLNYIDKRIADRRGNLSDDLISDLIRETDAGNLSENDLRNWLVKLAEANTDNSSHQIGIALIELSSRPEIWARLHRDGSLVPAAVREVMRFHPRSISTSREALEDLKVNGCLVPRGTPVFANIGAAHWNPKHYPNPGSLDIDRPPQPGHLNFGGGIFSCVGRFVVTIEVEETISLLARNFPRLRLDRTGFEHSPMFSSVSSLEATLDPA